MIRLIRYLYHYFFCVGIFGQYWNKHKLLKAMLFWRDNMICSGNLHGTKFSVTLLSEEAVDRHNRIYKDDCFSRIKKVYHTTIRKKVS